MLADAAELAQRFGPLAAFGVALVDRSGLPLLIGSVCAAVGAVGGNPVATIALATAGMWVGDVALFEVGAHSAATASLSRRFLRPLRPLRATARALILKYPRTALLFGRYVAGAGILIPVLAGSAHMRRARAYLLLTIGTIVYVAPWGALAFALGAGFEASMRSLESGVAYAAGAGLLAAVGVFAYMRVKRRARRAEMHADHHRRATKP